jgi:hypothetical protein
MTVVVPLNRFASQANVWTWTALRDALGSTYGLDSIPGANLGGQFAIYAAGAGALTGYAARSFNFADTVAGGYTDDYAWFPAQQFFGGWFGDRASDFIARQTTKMIPSWFYKQGAFGAFAEILIFYNGSGTAADVSALDTARLFNASAWGSFRSAWAAPAASQAVLAFKGGEWCAHLAVASRTSGLQMPHTFPLTRQCCLVSQPP